MALGAPAGQVRRSKVEKTRMKSPRCPVTGKPGKRVALVTVKSLARAEHGAALEERDWFFCDHPECSVVYFTRSGRTLGKEALKVRVGLKEKEAPRSVCYCFGHSVESIREEIERTGRSTVAASIREKVEAGACSCEVLNPSGTCCLGDVNRAVKEAFSSVGIPRPAVAKSARPGEKRAPPLLRLCHTGDPGRARDVPQPGTGRGEERQLMLSRRGERR
jgi:hypothetical protein